MTCHRFPLNAALQNVGNVAIVNLFFSYATEVPSLTLQVALGRRFLAGQRHFCFTKFSKVFMPHLTMVQFSHQF